jgi:hypothetical protein
MNQVRLESFNHFGSLHIGKIQGQTNCTVKGKGESLCMLDAEVHEFLGKVFDGCVAIYCQNIDLVAGFRQELEHFLEAVGVSRDVCKRRGFYHETNLARRISLEGRC